MFFNRFKIINDIDKNKKDVPMDVGDMVQEMFEVVDRTKAKRFKFEKTYSIEVGFDLQFSDNPFKIVNILLNSSI